MSLKNSKPTTIEIINSDNNILVEEQTTGATSLEIDLDSITTSLILE
jgi:hypothetical protein